MDEAICPADFRGAGLIVDDELHSILVASLPPGVRLTAIMDCCHSGTALDLPYIFAAKSGKNLEKKKKEKKKKNKKKGKKDSSDEGPNHGIVVMFSGCQDDQVSADVVLEGSATGAVSFSFITSMGEHNLDITFEDLMVNIKKILTARVKNVQYPMLTTNVENFDFTQKFAL